MAWLSAAEVQSYGGGGAPVTAGGLDLHVDAVQVFLQRKRPDLDWEAIAADPTLVGADMRLGAAMLAWRLYSRRNTPAGLAGSPEIGLSSIMRDDPDIARLCGIGRGGRFLFGSTPRRDEPVVTL